MEPAHLPDAAAKPTPVGAPSDRALRALPVLLVLLALAAWEAAVRSGSLSPLFYPPPSAIARALAGLAASGKLAAALGASLSRIFLGFAFGGGAGLLLGLAMGWSPRLRLVLDPLVAAAHPVPRLALLPLILLIFGIGETSRILVVALSCLFPMLINAMTGVRQIEPLYFEVARNFGARRAQILGYVVLPGSLPAVVAGSRLALISGLRTTLGIELITSDAGLGHLIWQSWERFNTGDLYAALAVTAALGILMNAGLKRVVSWAQPGGRMATL